MMPRMNFWQKLVALTCLPLGAWAQAPAGQPVGASSRAPAVVNSALDAQIFYEILLAELYVRGDQNGTGYSIMLDAARRSGDAGLFERAVGLALASRSGDAALQAARTWKREQPQALEPDRYLLQILVALNRIEEAGKLLQSWLQRLPLQDQAAAIASAPQLFERVSDKPLALSTARSALDFALQQPQTRAVALTSIGRMQRDSGQTAQAVATAVQAHRQDPQALGPLLLSMSLVQHAPGELKPLLDQAMRGDALSAELRMSYARMLINQGAPEDAATQLQLCIRKFPTYAPAWLVSGLLHMDKHQNGPAQTDLKRYLELAQDVTTQEALRGRARALIALAQLAQDMTAGNDESKRLDDMEKWLRQLMQLQPEDPQAYNMLGYSLADRGLRLPEALALIEKAVQLAPNDPFIQDSLGWVKFRMGDLQQAQRLLQAAYTERPDAEIAAHLGEVLWVMGDKDRAAHIWREGLRLNPENTTLRQTFQRLGYTP